MTNKSYYELAIDEIVNMIKDNLILRYKYCDYAFTNLKKYCKERIDDSYKNIPYDYLSFFVYETLIDLMNCDVLYDLRTLE